MASFKNLTIKAKVIAAFAAVLAVTLMLGIFAILRLAAVNHEAADIRDNWLPATRALGDIEARTERYRITQANYVMARTDDQRADAATRLDAALKMRDNAWAAYAPTVTPGKERQIVDGYLRNWSAYLEADKKLHLLVLSGKQDEAQNFFVNGMLAAFQRVRDSLEQDAELNQAEGQKAADRGGAIYASARNWVIGALVLTAIICLACGFSVVRGVVRPIAAMTLAMKRLAERDMTVEVVGVGRRDEIGAMADAMQVFKDNMIEADRMTAEQEAERRTKEERAARIEALTRSFETQVAQLVGALSSSATEMETTAQSMSATAEQTNQQSLSVTSAAEQASANVQTVATAAEELSASIGEIGRQIAQSNQVVEQAVADAQRTNDVVQTLSAGAQKIGEVVQLIQTIAGQTNLLALNATIEAARAGEAGKGFAVVASEVKALASQTGKATEEIAGQVTQIQQATQGTVDAIQRISATIAEVSKIAANIAAAVEEQGAATQEIARNVQQAAQGTEEVTNNIAGVKEAAASTGVAASQVLVAAGDVSRQSNHLSSEVDQFLAGIRAA